MNPNPIAHRQSAEAFAAHGLDYAVRFEVSTVDHLLALLAVDG